MRIEVIISGERHALEIDIEIGRILFDDQWMTISEISASHIQLARLDQERAPVSIELKDLYRALHGGLEPSLDRFGWFIAQHLRSKQHERAIFAQLAQTELRLKSSMPCAFLLPADYPCLSPTGKALMANNPGLVGSILILPLCANHWEAGKMQVSMKCGGNSK